MVPRRCAQGTMGKSKKRDPNKPRRALNGFLFFSKKRRTEIKEGNPSISFPELAKQIGEEWKKMADEDKAPFEKLALEDKVRYNKEMGKREIWGGQVGGWMVVTFRMLTRFETFPPLGKQTSYLNCKFVGTADGYQAPPEYAKKNTRRDPNKPKRAMTAYLHFCDAHRGAVKAENSDKDSKEILKILAEMWKETDEDGRMPFHKQAEADRERYDSEVLQLAEKRNRGIIEEYYSSGEE